MTLQPSGEVGNGRISKASGSSQPKDTKPITTPRRKRFYEYGLPVVLIDTWSSTCGNCGQGADPEAKTHDKVMDWSANGEPGCGVTWEFVSSNYSGPAVDEWCKRMRPDLEYLNYFQLLTKVSDLVATDPDASTDLSNPSNTAPPK